MYVYIYLKSQRLDLLIRLMYLKKFYIALWEGVFWLMLCPKEKNTKFKKAKE